MPESKGLKKFTVNLREEDIEALRELAEVKGTTMTGALRGAIATEMLLRKLDQEGSELLIKEKDGSELRKILILGGG